jgi:hypothetical protein
MDLISSNEHYRIYSKKECLKQDKTLKDKLYKYYKRTLKNEEYEVFFKEYTHILENLHKCNREKNTKLKLN